MNQTESRPWLTALAIALGAPAVLAACASSQFDSYIDAGQYEAAASEFARDSSLQEDPEAVLAVAEMYASPDSPLHDRQRATSMLRDWVARYPDDPNRYRAELALSLLSETDRLEAQLARQDSIAARMADDLAIGLTARDTLEGRVVTLIEIRQALTDSLEAQQNRINVLTAELRSVREELEQLKEIDVSGP